MVNMYTMLVSGSLFCPCVRGVRHIFDVKRSVGLLPAFCLTKRNLEKNPSGTLINPRLYRTYCTSEADGWKKNPTVLSLICLAVYRIHMCLPSTCTFQIGIEAAAATLSSLTQAVETAAAATIVAATCCMCFQNLSMTIYLI